MSFMQEFKAFAMKGNVVDMAVGIIIGGAFSKIVSSLVNDIIMPPLGLMIGGMNFSKLAVTLKHPTVDATGKIVEAVKVNYGNFIQTTIDFLIISFSIFLLIKAINSLRRKQEHQAAQQPPAQPLPTKEESLLTEIRDILKNEKVKSEK